MCIVSINVPEEILLDLHEDKNDFAEYMKKTMAVDLYNIWAEMVFLSSHLLQKMNFWRSQPMRKAVVNTTPLIALSHVGQLNLLQKMYGEIIIPEAVYKEGVSQ